MSDTILHHQPQNFNTQPTPADDLHAALRMLERLHRGGPFWLFLRAQERAYESDWRKAGTHGQPRKFWLHNDHLYFGVNPHTEIPQTNAKGEKQSPRWVRGTVANIAAVNCLFVEIDAKDTITEAEWLPHYDAPDLAGMTKQQARGALQKAQTAAIDAALVSNLEEYKRRARNMIKRGALRPSACWDSGGGYQAVWLLSETLPLTDSNRNDVAHVQKAWVELIGGDAAACDLNRVLRLPGSVNRKAKYGPDGHAVRFLWCDLALAYSFADLAALVPAAPEAMPKAPRRVYVPAGLPQELGDFADVPRLPQHAAIDEYNASTDLRGLLLGLGYTDAGSGRMNRPGGNTAGVQLHGDNTASIYSSADPLYCQHRVTPAHALCVFEHDGNPDAMLTALTGGAHARFLAQVAALRTWCYSAQAISWLREADVARAAGYSKTMAALAELAHEAGSLTITPGLRTLAHRANTSPATALRHVRRLAEVGWLEVESTEHGTLIKLKQYAPTTTSVSLRAGWHAEHLQHDAFVAVSQKHGQSRRLVPAGGDLLPSLGPAALHVWRELLAGAATRRGLVDATGLTAATVRSALSKMEALHLVTADRFSGRAAHWRLAADAETLLNEAMPNMTSYCSGLRWAEHADRVRCKWLHKRARAENDRAKRGRLLLNLDKTEKRAQIRRAQLDAVGIRPIAGRPQRYQRWDRHEMQRQQMTLAADLAAMDGSRADKVRWAMLAGYSAAEANQAMRPSVLAQLPQLAAAGD